MSKIKANKNKQYDWLILPQSYFLLAILGCDSLLSKISSKNIPKPFKKSSYDSLWNEKYNYPHFLGYLILPIVFNFKHGIELYLKAIGNIQTLEYENNHDLVYLLNSLITKIQDNKIKNNEEILKSIENDIRPIIEKYYYGLYIPNVKFRNKPDCNNFAERYPENNSYKIPEISYCELKDVETFVVDQEKIQEIREDILKLSKQLRKIGNKLSSSKK